MARPAAQRREMVMRRPGNGKLVANILVATSAYDWVSGSRTGDQCRQPQLGPVSGEDVTIKLTFGQWRRHDEDLGLVSGHCLRMEIQEYDSRLKRGWEVLGKRPLIVIPKYSYEYLL